MRKTAIVTGSGGLVGVSITKKLIQNGYLVYGIDRDMRKELFGERGSVASNIDKLREDNNYIHNQTDIREKVLIPNIILEAKPSIIVHCASQPSHDFAATNPLLDFDINVNGTMNLLESARMYCPEALFVFLSSSKIYGSKVNGETYLESEKRYDFTSMHPLYEGITERYGTDDAGIRSLFGASKLAADVMVREYGMYYNIPTVCLRSSCISGGNHSGVEQHGFLSYFVKCAKNKIPYNIFGYKGKQVRDNIHADDLSNAIIEINKNFPKPGEIFNIGGGRERSCSILEVIDALEDITENKMVLNYVEKARIGDHMWWIHNSNKLQLSYPNWKQNYSLHDTIMEIYNNQ